MTYRRPGEKPVIGKRAYIPNAGYGPPEYVISKCEKPIEQKKFTLPPVIYNTYVNNQFYYLVNDDCEIEFLKCSTKFKFLTYTNEKEFKNVDIYNLKYNYAIFTLKSSEVNQISDTEIIINHSLNSVVDLIILNNETYFYDYSYIEIDPFNIKIKFNSLMDLRMIKILIYQIKSYNSSLVKFNYNIINLNNENFSFDINNNRFKIRNVFGTTQLKVKINSINGETKNINSLNITPSYIFFNKDEIISLDQLEEEKTTIESQQFISTDENLSDRYNEIVQKITELTNKNDYGIDIGTIEIYYPIENIEKKYIQFGKSNDIIKWDSDDFNYYIEIQHSLNGYVNYLFDNDVFNVINYEIKYISNNKIKMIISKNEQIPLSFSLSLFKVGDN